MRCPTSHICRLPPKGIDSRIPDGLFLPGPMSKYVPVDLDRISTRAAELAAAFGVRAPLIVAGDVPAWSTLGLRYSAWNLRPALKAGPGFDRLPAAEQDGALAMMVLAIDFQRTGANKTALIYGLSHMAIALPLIYVAAYHEVPRSVTLSIFGGLYILGYLLTFGLRFFRMIHRVDHRVAEVMGRPVVDLMMDHEIRNAHLIPRSRRLLFALYCPTRAQPLRRLDAAFGPRRITA